MIGQNIFPFCAIVGQGLMQQALVLNAVDPRIGGVLIRGERGTAKSTAARALAALLARINVNEGCRFHCDPETPITWCSECTGRRDKGGEIGSTSIPTPYVNLPISVTEDRVVGTLDIEKAIQKGERAFEPGTLAAANRGLLYIDEINLLDDHIVDILLDSAAMGVNIVEREGISFSHPARFILVGTMNPEEGELRPQLVDRFGLSVEIHGVRSPGDRATIIGRCLHFEDDPAGFRAQWSKQEQELSEKIRFARSLVDQITYSQNDLQLIAAINSELKVDGHRADLVILKTARAQAAFEGRASIAPADIHLASLLALPHRMKRNPFGVEAAIPDLDTTIIKVLNRIDFPVPKQVKRVEIRV